MDHQVKKSLPLVNEALNTHHPLLTYPHVVEDFGSDLHDMSRKCIPKLYAFLPPSQQLKYLRKILARLFKSQY